MPIYEFECEPCKNRFEILMSASKISEAKCPSCGGGKIRRIFSPFFTRMGGGGSSHSHDGCEGCASGQCASCGHH